MEIQKKHILKTYKNEQDAINAIEQIKEEKETPFNSSTSGYNVERSTAEKYSADIDEPAFEDFEDEPSQNPDPLANKSTDLERPIPERDINYRVR